MKPIYFLILSAVLLASCSSAPSANTVQTAIAETQAAQPAQQEPISSPVALKPKDTTIPTVPPKPTATKEPTATEVPTVVPSPTYSQPVVLIEFSGTGATVTDDYQLPECRKGVLYWHVNAGSYNFASLILNAYNKGISEEQYLVSAYASDVGEEGLSGSALLPLTGGTYYFSSENTDEAWTTRIECQDGVAPVGSGIDLQVTGNIVTDNYTLSACQKSIFSWSVEPDSNKYASLMIDLCDQNECNNLVMGFQQDTTSQLTGDAVQSVKAGDYFLVSTNSNQPWTVKWECKD
jgi:hypothetical protein